MCDNIISLYNCNLIKTYFNKETLSEIHISLNNIDKLKYLIGKAYKTLHPFEQGIMGVYHNISIADSNLVNYVYKIDFYNDNQVIIIYMLAEQTQKLIILE
ncbi:hypothetical protein C1645_836096 [Glomus cerebriforme]|uniref:Uncharacterized protein n=1 Tax=Glomus cerebriforme TaxID=658196 RepID=A0A397SHL1_9GLOM|nr:hypothetical protein C1645_836096 [Glomus cerebriforme]